MISYLKYIFVFVFLFLVIGCKPTHLSINGINPEMNGSTVRNITYSDNQLVLLVVSGGNTTNEIKISPWQKTSYDILLIEAIVSAEITRTPIGLISRLSFYRNDSLITRMNCGARNFSEILPGFQLYKGKITQKMDNMKRNWTDALIKDQSGKTIECEPGKIVTLEQEGKKWSFVLIGASAPLPKPEKKLTGTNILVGEIADEAPGFMADYVLFLQ